MSGAVWIWVCFPHLRYWFHRMHEGNFFETLARVYESVKKFWKKFSQNFKKLLHMFIIFIYALHLDLLLLNALQAEVT